MWHHRIRHMSQSVMNEEFDYEYEYDENGEIVYYAIRPNKTQLKKDTESYSCKSMKSSGKS